MLAPNANEVTLSFIAEWFDPHPRVVKRYLLKYYPKSHEVEMKEVESSRKFLKRTEIDKSLSKDEFFVGATVIIFSRDLKLVNYGDNETRSLLDPASEKTIAFLTPSASALVGKVIASAEGAGLTLVDLKAFAIDCNLASETAAVLGLDGDQLRSDDVKLCICMEFRGDKAMKTLLDTIGSNGCTELKNQEGIIIASSFDEAKTYKDLFLSKTYSPTAKYDPQQSTCCVIKPHIIKSRMVGKIVEDILARGLDINAIQLFHLDRTTATEFYEVYKDLKEYHSKSRDGLYLLVI